MTEKGGFWYNYQKGDYEYIEGTPDDLSPYIPQWPPAQQIYKLLVEHEGWNPLKAARYVLERIVKEENDEV